jgi:hypothetical protein
MISFLLVLLLFLLAFTGLATGILIRGKGIAGGCSSSGTASACQCKSSSDMKIKVIVKKPE